MRFTQRTVLVTGASSGIGRQLAQAFAQEGAAVVVSGRSSEALSQTVKLISDDGGQASAVTADVTQPAQVGHLIQEVLERHGRLDVAVNNAGVLATGALADMSLDDWRRMIDVNTTGVFLAMRQEIAAMRAGGGGAIVNIGSNVGAHLRIPTFGGYAASKAAVSALSRAAALEHVGDGIRVNVVSPGPVDTTMSLLPGETDAQRADRMAGLLPIGRVATRDEIARTVLWLASDEASYVVGHDLVVDGGASA